MDWFRLINSKADPKRAYLNLNMYQQLLINPTSQSVGLKERLS